MSCEKKSVISVFYSRSDFVIVNEILPKRQEMQKLLEN